MDKELFRRLYTSACKGSCSMQERRNYRRRMRRRKKAKDSVSLSCILNRVASSLGLQE